ncbi:PAS domain S-box protein [Actinomycetospora sp. CA-084318]|uniref:PAS domain S-box protein n=1 Tax=Actinomycetospora sp. CA-084318 TaxID=3239892 RepID=UPI003D96641E
MASSRVGFVQDGSGTSGTMPFVEGHAVIATDVEGVITSWNDGAQELFGHRREDVLGRPVDVVVPEHLRAAHWAGFRRGMAAPAVKDLAADLPVLCADGEVRSFAGRLLVLCDALGTSLGAMAVYAATGTTGVRPFG